MKKKRITFIIIGSCVLLALSIGSFCFFAPLALRAIISGHNIKKGINNYHPAVSSVSLCQWLTVRSGEENGGKYGTILFINKYEYLDAFFCYDYNYTFTKNKETVALILEYTETNYSMALDDVMKQPGFSNELTFRHNSFSFYLNDTERQVNGSNCFTNYDILCEKPYLCWINLVGYSNDLKQIAFLGFYYEEYKNPYLKATGFYDFNGFDTLLEEQFGYYDWINGKENTLFFN